MIQPQERLNPLTDEQIAEYERDGYLILRNVCSDDLVDMYNAHIYHIRAQDDMPEWALPRKGPIRAQDRFTVRVFNPHLHDGFSLQMLRHPVIRGALAQLLGDEAVGVQSMYFYKEPGSPGQAAHQDYFYIRNEPNTLTAAWMAMEDVDVENGCLWAIPGSHHVGLLPHGKVKNVEEHEPWTDESEGVDLSKEIPLEMKKGDVVIFHNLLVHSSRKNRSVDRWRRSYVGHYIRHDSVIEREDLKKKIPLS
ncbi:phytanoyl-CoA dioxygenase family protein [Alicyclobacillus fastidiosus]|uniref:Phytanoyl-CoA dioxygenase family protein n=1 Tax=Alicyclobacillus fastidiosus TaxID=392011 RepID=A0ABY6ZAI1_9BACL|nr:phytanoyl-CoA dioxygenase family protein [Alicyclobacillus fastidiosus]WAH39871.1 phytanoyl-CoA dioxygenase family protein [Alicyclobacillus fastidiosus]GMA61138.1 phytanoyl-CoA dioxygenase [Alicyclobacillus fastidiosus]